MTGKMEKCNFCQTPGSERPHDMPRACEEVCPTGAILSGSLAELAQKNRQKVAEKLGSSSGGMQGFPGVVVDGAERFGSNE
jgi:anaerobic dimethyl sulfoxide reductase subunit B (iron-sulfur subunit)